MKLSDLRELNYQLVENILFRTLGAHAWGGSTYGTQIKNYPVQGFATADIVPLACINIYNLMKEKKVKSLLINTVHDSIIADVYPGEEKVMSDIFNKGTARCNTSH